MVMYVQDFKWGQVYKGNELWEGMGKMNISGNRDR